MQLNRSESLLKKKERGERGERERERQRERGKEDYVVL
jgi:hypothetical protein